MRRIVTGVVVGVGILAATLGQALAERVLRADEIPVGRLDPHKAVDVSDSYLMYNLYDTLVFPGLGEDYGRIMPHLAESVEVEGKNYTFRLRDGVHFHSGNALDAEDVIFSLERMLALGQGFSHLFEGWVEDMEAVDDRTVRITLSDIYAPFLAALTRLSIVDREAILANLEDGDHGDLRDYGQTYLDSTSAGTGAYRTETHDPQDLTVLRRFDDYFLGHGDTAPDVVRIRYGLRDATLMALMSRGEHDLTSQWISPETKRALHQMPGIRLVGEPGIAQYWIKLHTQKPPLDDVHCRRALAYAIDYAALRSQVDIAPDVSGGIPSRGPLLPTMIGYDESVPVYEQDMERAREELAQCRYAPDDHVIQISWIAEVSIEERYALLMQQNWAELGFTSEVVRMPWALYVEATSNKESTPHVGQLFYNARTPDPDAYLYSVYHSGSHGRFAGAEWLDDEEVDRMLELGRSTTDPDDRAEIYREFAEKIRDLQPSIFGYYVVNMYGARDALSIPNLEDPTWNTGLMGGNVLFRYMDMK